MRRNLEKAVRAFLAQHRRVWNTQKRAYGSCQIASHEFHGFLRGKGLRPTIWHITVDKQHDSYICPEWYPDEVPPHGYNGHTVVYAGGVVVDWTARQYNPKAPYPLVFQPRFGGDRRAYDRWLRRRESWLRRTEKRKSLTISRLPSIIVE
jgi:hypothetical protein